MAAKRRYTLNDDEDEPKKGWKWTPMTIGLCAGGGVLLLGLVIGVFLLMGGGGRKSLPSVPREEFTRAVMGKTKEEILQAVGKPNLSSSEGGNEQWYYIGRTRDPNGTTDNKVLVIIDGKTGRCVKVSN